MNITLEKALELIAIQADRIFTLENENQTAVSELEKMREKKDYWFDEYIKIAEQLQNASEESVISLENKEAV